MMPAGAYRAERVPSAARDHFIDGGQARTGSAARSVQAVNVHRGVRIELQDPLAGCVRKNQVHVGRVMNTLQVLELRQRCIEAAEPIEQPRFTHVLTHGSHPSCMNPAGRRFWSTKRKKGPIPNITAGCL